MGYTESELVENDGNGVGTSASEIGAADGEIGLRSGQD